MYWARFQKDHPQENFVFARLGTNQYGTTNFFIYKETPIWEIYIYKELRKNKDLIIFYEMVQDLPYDSSIGKPNKKTK